MIQFKNLLAIGATNRNLGKTEFICRILERFAKHEIIAIKIKSIYPDDKKFHGKDLDPDNDFLIRKENSVTGLEDSRRFIAAGAKSVYYIKSKIDYLNKAIIDVKSQYPDNQLFVAESNSVLQYFIPGGFLMIKGPNPVDYKPSSLKFMDQANITIKSNGKAFDIMPEKVHIRINNNTWEL